MIRAIVTIELSVWGKTEEELIKEAKKIASFVEKQKDNGAKVVSVIKNDFGSLETKQIYPNPKK